MGILFGQGLKESASLRISAIAQLEDNHRRETLLCHLPGVLRVHSIPRSRQRLKPIKQILDEPAEQFWKAVASLTSLETFSSLNVYTSLHVHVYTCGVHLTCILRPFRTPSLLLWVSLSEASRIA